MALDGTAWKYDIYQKLSHQQKTIYIGSRDVILYKGYVIWIASRVNSRPTTIFDIH